jgi:hypothetical protein
VNVCIKFITINKGQSKIGNPEKLVTRRGNQKWTIQRNWQHEGAIKNRQSRETGNTKGQSIMDNPEKLAT